jgi:hypothetical protein
MVPALPAGQRLPDLRNAATDLPEVLLRLDGIAWTWAGMEAGTL